MVVTRWAAVLVMGATSLVSAPSVFAASTATQAFLANLVSNVDFLDRSSRFALKNSKKRPFARLRVWHGARADHCGERHLRLVDGRHELTGGVFDYSESLRSEGS